MLRITIDPSVVAVPRDVRTRDQLYEYVDALRHWKELLAERWAVVMMSERAGGVLTECGAYPFFDRLKELFRGYELEEYDANTVYRIACGLLTHTPSFEAHYRVEDVLADGVETSPDLLYGMEGEDLRAEVERCVLLLAIVGTHSEWSEQQHCMVLRGTSKGVARVRGEVQYVAHERDDLGELPFAPEIFEGEVAVGSNFRDVIEGIDEERVLVEARDDADVELAIRVAVFRRRLAREDVADWTVEVPVIGRDFRVTCLQCCMEQGGTLARRVLQSVVETAGKENLRQVHELRTGRGGNDPQQRRGRDKAQRRDIDREFHLHYWECEGGRIELASVVHHNDFSIPR